jgi:hypothetical protein
MTKNALNAEIRRFATEHPEGWGHDEWTGFLTHLSEVGHDVTDADEIGLALETERLSQTLRRMEINGLGPKRMEDVANHFGTLWNLMSASQEELTQVPSISRPLAEQILEVLQ